jgi:hypothetical protein
MDNRQAFIMMDLFNIDDLGTAKPLQIRDVSVADLLELE